MRDPMDVFAAADEGQTWGEREGGRIRDARAYRTGGLDAVAEAAGRTGDLTRYDAVRGEQRTARRFDDDRRQAAYTRMETIAPWALNLVRGTRDLDPERRRAALSQPQYVQRFLDFGFSQEQVNQGIEGLSNPDAAVRRQVEQELETAFTQHQNPDWQIADPTTGQIGAIDRLTGEYVAGGRAPPQQPEWQAGYGRAYRIHNDGRTELGGSIPHAPRGGGTGGQAPSGYRWTADGQSLEPIPGGPRAGAGQADPQEAINELRRMGANVAQARNASWGEHGIIGAVSGAVPGTGAYNLRNSVLPSLRANLAFDALIRLKSSGGTLGAISDAELQLLQSKVAALDPNAGEQEFERQLSVVEQQIQSSLQRIQEAADASGDGTGDTPSPGGAASTAPLTPAQARAELARRRAAAARGGGG